MPAQTEAGDLDFRITVQRHSVNINAFNEAVPVYATIASLWAQRTDASAAESYRAQEVGAQITARFKIRHSTLAATITEKDRILFEDRTYNITQIRRIGRREWIELDAVARDDQR